MEPSPPEKLTEARKLNAESLVDPSGDRLVQAVRATFAVGEPLRLAPGRCRTFPVLVVELSMCLRDGGADKVRCLNDLGELI